MTPCCQCTLLMALAVRCSYLDRQIILSEVSHRKFNPFSIIKSVTSNDQIINHIQKWDLPIINPRFLITEFANLFIQSLFPCSLEPKITKVDIKDCCRSSHGGRTVQVQRPSERDRKLCAWARTQYSRRQTKTEESAIRMLLLLQIK